MYLSQSRQGDFKEFSAAQETHGLLAGKEPHLQYFCIEILYLFL